MGDFDKQFSARNDPVAMLRHINFTSVVIPCLLLRVQFLFTLKYDWRVLMESFANELKPLST